MEMNFKKLGPYEIGDKIGAGGMGTVFSAVDSETGQVAAVKVLAPALAMQQGFRERFESEIESLKKLEHPNIVKLYGYGQKDAFPFYAMELVEGANLEEELSNGRRFDWREVTRIGIKLSRALKLAHDHGVIHRDIKPANVLIDQDGEIKLSDFGVARLFGNTGLTSEGGVLGTAEYMAPEQADGSRVTHRCDLYSLGGVMYALLAGRPPFRSKSMLELLQLQRFATPDSVRRYAPESPKEIEQIINRLLAKDPADRFPNALMLTRRLEAMEIGLSLQAEALKKQTPGETLVDTSSPEESRAGVNGNSGSSSSGDHSSGASNSEFDEGASDLAAKGTLAADNADNESAQDENLDDTMERVVDADGKIVALAAVTADVNGSHSDAASAIHDQDDFDHGYDHFTTIEEERRRQLISEREEIPLISLPTVFLIISLLFTGYLIWHWASPPSESELLSKIESIARTGDDVRLREVEEEIGTYLRLYADSSDANRVEEYQNRLNAARMAGRAVRHANDLFRRFPDSIVAGDYIEAVELIATQPEQALARLQAIVDLYGEQASRPEEIRRFVDAAAAQIPRLRRRVEERRDKFRQQIQRDLNYAEQLRETNPEKARQALQAIVALYASEPWAVDLVVRAREILQTLPPEQVEEVEQEVDRPLAEDSAENKPAQEVNESVKDEDAADYRPGSV